MDEARRQRMMAELAKAKGRSRGVPKPDFVQLADVPPDLRADTLTEADPESWSNWLADKIAGGISHGAPDATDRRVASFLTGTQVPGTGLDEGRGIGVADFVPFLGEGLSADDASQAYKRGDYLGTALGAMGAVVPAAGKLAKRGGKTIAEAFSEETKAAREARLAGKAGGQFNLLTPSEKFKKASAGAQAKKEAAQAVEDEAGYDPYSARRKAEPKQAVEGTWGKKDRPDVTFEGVEPKQFTPGQWGRFGKHYGAHNIGPEDENAWYDSLQKFTSKSGNEYTVPGGLESKEPFSYFDDLFMKSQGINPNDLTPEQHLAIHNRMVAGKQAPPGGFKDSHIFNQLGGMGLLSPNNPLTPNEFAAAATMAKGSGKVDLEEISKAAGDFDYAKHPMFEGKDSPFPQDVRRERSAAITERLGTQAAERGGTGVSGNQDYTTLVGLAQMMREKPEFFRFKGVDETPGIGHNSSTPDMQWTNFVDRLQSQVPGLAGKTGSFGSVWQDPVNAATSAMDRHMLNTFRDKVFSSPEEEAAWTQQVLHDWHNPKPPRAKPGEPPPPPMEPRQQVSNLDELRQAPGGTNFFNDKIFGYVNKPDEGTMRVARSGEVNPRVPEHLRPENADYVKEPARFTSMGPAYRRGIEANKASKEASGATGVFSDQWRVWDPIRNRLEPHEINQPGLVDLPRQSERQHAESLQEHADLGYLNYTKDPEGNLQGVRPAMFKEGEQLTEGQQRMREMLAGLNPSKLAYFVLPLLAGAGLGGGVLSDQNRERSNAL